MTSSQREFGQFPNMFIHTLLSQTAPSCLHRHRLGIQNKPTPHAKICPSHENTPTKLTQTWHIDTLPSRNTRKHWFHVVHFLQKKTRRTQHLCLRSLFDSSALNNTAVTITRTHIATVLRLEGSGTCTIEVWNYARNWLALATRKFIPADPHQGRKQWLL